MPEPNSILGGDGKPNNKLKPAIIIITLFLAVLILAVAGFLHISKKVRAPANDTAVVGDDQQVPGIPETATIVFPEISERKTIDANSLASEIKQFVYLDAKNIKAESLTFKNLDPNHNIGFFVTYTVPDLAVKDVYEAHRNLSVFKNWSLLAADQSTDSAFLETSYALLPAVYKARITYKTATENTTEVEAQFYITF